MSHSSSSSTPSTPPSLSQRDLLVVRLVARFKQMSAKQIRALVFSNNSNNTPSDRSLVRLVNLGYLRRIERRLVGGSRGGSGQYVYELARKGWFMHNDGPYYPARSVRPHVLAIVDAFIELRSLELAGTLSIVGLSTEPDCWQVVGGVELKPDLRVDVVARDQRKHLLWLEIDMGTEAQRQLRGQLESYWRAYSDVDATEFPVFPRVVWVAVDDERARELRWLISQLRPEQQPLFTVVTAGQLHTLF